MYLAIIKAKIKCLLAQVIKRIILCTAVFYLERRIRYSVFKEEWTFSEWTSYYRIRRKTLCYLELNIFKFHIRLPEENLRGFQLIVFIFWDFLITWVNVRKLEQYQYSFAVIQKVMQDELGNRRTNGLTSIQTHRTETDKMLHFYKVLFIL